MKKKTFFALLIMIAGIFLLGYFTFWWIPAAWVVLVAYMMKLDIKTGIITGGVSFALVWVAMAIFMNVQDSADIISKTGILLGGLSQWMMLLVALIISLITGILSGWLGSAIAMYSTPSSKR